jgi:formate dehydrogenase major subunit
VFGSGAMTNSIAEFEDSQCIFIIGSNTSEAHPLIANRILRAKAKGAKIIVADPRRIHIAFYADIHVRQNLGTDVALLNGIMNIVIANGWQAQTYIDERTENYDALKETVAHYPPEKVSEITGVSVRDLNAIAEAYAKAPSASIVYAMGITQHTTGVDNVKTLANLAMLCGRLGFEGCGVNPLRGQNNVQGACDMGALPNVYSGYQQVADDTAAQKFETAWGVQLSRKPGLTIMDMMHAIDEGKLRALYIMGENPVVSDPNRSHVEAVLQKTEFLVVQDIFMTETAQYAHVVLPGVSFAEKDGTFSNTERRVQRVRKAIEPVGNSRPDWEIICSLSTMMGLPMEFPGPKEIQDEIASVTPSYGGITYARLDGEGLQWPCPNPEHPGTKYLHKERFTRGKGLFSAIEYKPPAETRDDEFPLMLTTGRNFVHYHTGTLTRQSRSLDDEQKEGYAEINPLDAQKYGISKRDLIHVISRRGAIDIKPEITERVPIGTLFIPFHFAEAAANTLTIDALDPVAKIPEYKVCAVRIEKAGAGE